jgi:hypothetical protein
MSSFPRLSTPLERLKKAFLFRQRELLLNLVSMKNPSSIGALAIISLMLAVGPAWAGSRSSANYSVTTETVDAGGARSTGGIYTNDGTMGGVAGISTVSAPAGTAKHGYVGQLHEVTGLQVTASGTTVGEGSTLQLNAVQIYDDSTTASLNSGTVSWSVLGVPVVSISLDGLATAATVYQNTSTTVRGSFEGRTSDLGITVINLNSDDYGTYAGDLINDDWQVQYFGFDNPFAAPTLNPDGDLHNNRFEFLAGLIPTDPNSRFNFRVQAVPGLPGQKNLVFSPIVAGRTYTVKYSTSLTAPVWQDLTGSTFSDAANVRTVTDTDASGARRYYRVDISMP